MSLKSVKRELILGELFVTGFLGLILFNTLSTFLQNIGLEFNVWILLGISLIVTWYFFDLIKMAIKGK
jgi:hypothetical protein